MKNRLSGRFFVVLSDFCKQIVLFVYRGFIFKSMKLKGWVVFFLFSTFLVLEGCSMYDYHERTMDLDQARIYSIYWQANDTTEYTSASSSRIGSELDVFSIKLDLNDDSLFVDVYGCTDYGCTKAEKIVVHNEDFSYSKLLKKDDFKISTPDAKYTTNEFGYDCDVVKDYYFRLKIDLDDFKIDLDAQKGTESCYTRSNPWCIYC
jgi:hypothetical protein